MDRRHSCGIGCRSFGSVSEKDLFFRSKAIVNLHHAIRLNELTGSLWGRFFFYIGLLAV